MNLTTNNGIQFVTFKLNGSKGSVLHNTSNLKGGIIVRKEEFLNVVSSLGLDKSQYCIIASGVMLMYGLREEVDDIDIKVTPQLFQRLLDEYHMKQSERYDYVYELTDNIDVNCRDFNPNDIKYVDGYPVEKLEKQLAWKLANNRPKDLADIQKIQTYLKKHEEEVR